MDFFGILAMVGGLALFLYGMDVMGTGLKKSAGRKLKTILGNLTSSKFKGFLLGLGVTAVGLVSKERYEKFLADEKALEELIFSLEHESVKGGERLDDLLESRGYARTGAGIVKAELLKRPEITINDVLELSGSEKEYDKTDNRY